MKILKIIHGYPPTYNAGSEVYSQSLCQALHKNHDVWVFSREENEYQLDFQVRETIRNQIPVTLVNLPREKDGYDHIGVNQAFQKTLDQFQPDIVHIGHLNHLSLSIVKITKERGIPIVFTLHDFWLMCPRGQFLQRNFDGVNLYRLCEGQDDAKCAQNCYKMLHSCRKEEEEKDLNYWTGWIAKRMEAVRTLLPLIDLFIAPSKYLKNRFVNDFSIPQEQIIYLDYGFPLDYLKPIAKEKNLDFTFCYIGTHLPAKGINLLIQAFKQIALPAQLIIWGRDKGQSTQALKAIAKGSKNPIVFKSEYNNREIAKKVFAQSDAIVVPSIWGENSPLVIHEAQACKIPVITADFGGMKEYVQHQVNGLLFKHREWKDLYAKMKWAIENKETLKSYGARGYLQNKDGQVQSMQDHCDKLVNIYQKIINKNGSSKRTLENNH